MISHAFKLIPTLTTMSSPNPSDYDGKVTQEQIDLLETKRVAFETALTTGSADLDSAREDYQTYANEILIDLSGKLEPTNKPPVTNPPAKPTEGTIKEPDGWGANTDPDSWKTSKMKDPADQFKVVDDKGVNVATNFTTEANAQGYIDYARWEDQNKPNPPDGGTTDPTGNVDKNGIKCIYPSSIAKREFDNFKLEEKMRNYASGKKSEWSTEYTCDTKDIIQNVEATIYEKINGFKSEADTISLKLNGPPHKDGARFWVIPDFATDGSPKRTLEIEDPHPNNHSVNPKPMSEIGGSLIGKWIGYKGISIVIGNKRHVESWIHYPVSDIENVKAEQDKWRQYISYDINEAKYLKATGSLVTSRLDGVKKGDPPTYKYAIVREIQKPT